MLIKALAIILKLAGDGLMLLVIATVAMFFAMALLVTFSDFVSGVGLWTCAVVIFVLGAVLKLAGHAIEPPPAGEVESP